MEPATIDIDGHIDLIDRQQSEPLAEADRARQSRLADVMIVLERERAALEQDLLVRLAPAMSQGIDTLALDLDATQPRFHVAIQPALIDDATARDLTAEQRATLESETADAVYGLIEQRAAQTPTPRWQPVVSATYRGPASEPAPLPVQAEITPTQPMMPPQAAAPQAATPAKTAGTRRTPSIWLHMLFWLLALVLLGTAYLYLTQSGG